MFNYYVFTLVSTVALIGLFWVILPLYQRKAIRMKSESVFARAFFSIFMLGITVFLLAIIYAHFGKAGMIESMLEFSGILWRLFSGETVHLIDRESALSFFFLVSIVVQIFTIATTLWITPFLHEEEELLLKKEWIIK
ncbi:hypothetical protein COU17_00610 [Candidatus Kaiserbacteria bacterium CG10_big_fil_rev_8_21_14_0_10_49_17]|uniref:Uncharacterized protein n=1 Tax=Candidatus Kaiserbacteria bacterium CG10_big_fil_rev_8_21_14_0_10_49_17 TaxID=1974609 RepID=A0A2M6WFC9_9BACT|nr:MAG: hypothetical protein COU17_00610 [Candidatus Kaiserbacteria bacterium CG10_big_fil_rev_8_21_14_0_10_49_17]